MHVKNNYNKNLVAAIHKQIIARVKSEIEVFQMIII